MRRAGYKRKQVHRANQGDVPSQIALGELFYWGARGVPRDQVRALNYFTAAADAGDNTARCAAAVSQADAFRRLLPDWTYQVSTSSRQNGGVSTHRAKKSFRPDVRLLFLILMHVCRTRTYGVP